MVDLVLTLIHVGRLNLGNTVDRAAFRRFVSWLAMCDEDSKVWARAVIERVVNVVSGLDLRRELLDAVHPRTSGTRAATQTAA